MNRKNLGLPEDWSRVEDWLNFKGPIGPPPVIDDSIFKIKCPELPTLIRYDTEPPASFWKSFPSCNLLLKASTKLNPGVLARILCKQRHLLTPSQHQRGIKVVDYLSNGAPSCQKSPGLPPTLCKNAKSALKNGKEVTDMLGFFVKSGYVAGPFSSPPLKDFRENSLLAVEQDTKV